MPEFIHERAKHLLAKNPDMKKSTAFAVATQQSHAVGKTPKGYGTSEGKREAKQKFDKPKKEYVKSPNPGNLKTKKLPGKAKMKWTGSHLVEKKKSAGIGGLLGSDQDMPQPKGLHPPSMKLKGTTLPFLSRERGVEEQWTPSYTGFDKKGSVMSLLPPFPKDLPFEKRAEAIALRRALLQEMLTKEGALPPLGKIFREGLEYMGQHGAGGAAAEFAPRAAQEAAQAAAKGGRGARAARAVESVVGAPGRAAKAVREARGQVQEAVNPSFFGRLKERLGFKPKTRVGRAAQAVRGAAEKGRKFEKGMGELGQELGAVGEQVGPMVGRGMQMAEPYMAARAAAKAPKAQEGLGRYFELLTGSRAGEMRKGKEALEQAVEGQGLGRMAQQFQEAMAQDPAAAMGNLGRTLPKALQEAGWGSLQGQMAKIPLGKLEKEIGQEAAQVARTRALTAGGLGAGALGVHMLRQPEKAPPRPSASPQDYYWRPPGGMTRLASAKLAVTQRDNPYMLDQIGREPKVRPARADAPEPKHRVKQAFAPTGYGPTGGPHFMPGDKYLPPFEVPPIKSAGPPSEKKSEERTKTSALRDELIKLNGFMLFDETIREMKTANVSSPQSQLGKAQRVGPPKATAPAGPSIADVSKPVGYGRKLPGATKNRL